MWIDAVFAVLLLLPIAMAGYVLLNTRAYISDSTLRQRELGREVLARYQETRFYYFFVKFLCLVLIAGFGFVFIVVIRHIGHFLLH